MSETCVFCDAEKYGVLEINDPANKFEINTFPVPVCVDCLNRFEEYKRREQ